MGIFFSAFGSIWPVSVFVGGESLGYEKLSGGWGVLSVRDTALLDRILRG